MQQIYAASVTRDDEDFVVSVRDLPEVVTSGDSLAEALDLAADAIAVVVARRMEDDEALPAPTLPRKGEHAVALPPQIAAKAAIYSAWKASGLSKSELARRLGCAENEVRRILTPGHNTKLERLEDVAHALGRRIVIGLEAA